MKGRSRETLGLLLGFIGVAIFAGTLPATRIAVETMNPVFVAAARAVIAAAAALPLLLMLRRPLPARDDLGRLALGALLLAGGFPAFSGWAMQHVPVAHGTVFIGLSPLLTAAFGSLLSGDRPSRLFWTAAVSGAATVIAFAMYSSGKGGFSIGDPLLVAASASAALGYAVSAGVSKRMSGWEVISWQVVLALPLSLPFALWTVPSDFGAVETRHWLALCYAGLFSMYLGFCFWNAGLAIGGVARVSQVQLLQSFITLLVVMPINGERPDAVTWLAAAAVVGAVLVGRMAAIRRG